MEREVLIEGYWVLHLLPLHYEWYQGIWILFVKAQTILSVILKLNEIREGSARVSDILRGMENGNVLVSHATLFPYPEYTTSRNCQEVWFLKVLKIEYFNEWLG